MARLTSDSVNDDKKLKLQHCPWLPLPQIGLGLDHLKLGQHGLVRDHLPHLVPTVNQTRQQLGTMQGTPRSL